MSFVRDNTPYRSQATSLLQQKTIPSE